MFRSWLETTIPSLLPVDEEAPPLEEGLEWDISSAEDWWLSILEETSSSTSELMLSPSLPSVGWSDDRSCLWTASMFLTTPMVVSDVPEKVVVMRSM